MEIGNLRSDLLHGLYGTVTPENEFPTTPSTLNFTGPRQIR